MGSPYSADLERMSDVVERMARFDTALDVHLEKLDRRIARLHTTWTGDAARTQHEAHREWMRAATDMRSALATMRSITATARSNYHVAVIANLRMWDDAL
jgi:WXG100 family type VII secretion target